MTTSTATGRLTYRLFEADDLAGVLQLWERESGWGTLTAETWRKWYVETPYGPCIVAVAADEEGEILGQLVFTPAMVTIDGTMVKGLRLSAPVLAPRLRGTARSILDHPVARLYRVGIEEARARGHSVVYAFTQSAWLSFFRSGVRMGLPPFADAEYPCLARPFAPPPPASLSRGCVASRITQFGEEFHALWETARTSFPIHCGVVRKPGWLDYKNSSHLTLEVRDPEDGVLVGYSAMRARDGLLMDILARRPAHLTTVLAATLEWLASRSGDPSLGGVDTLKAMASPQLERALNTLGFEPVDYLFAFVCNPLEAELALEEIAPERWYLTPGD